MSGEVLLVAGVLYAVLAVAAIVVVRMRMPAGASRVSVLATLAAVLFAPTLLVGHGAIIVPWWLALLSCLQQDCYGHDVNDLYVNSGVLSLLVVWIVFLVVGFVGHGLVQLVRSRR